MAQKTLDEIYKGKKKSLDEIYKGSSSVTQETLQAHPELGSFAGGATTLEEGQKPLGEKALGLGKTLLGAIADPLTQFGGSVLEGVTGTSQNEMLGNEENKSLQGITGNRVDKFGYRDEQKLTPGETAKQVGGNVLTNASLALPFLRGGRAMLAANPIKGGLGLGYTADVGQNLSEGKDINLPFTKDSALTPGLGTVLGGGLGVLGRGGQVVAKPASEMKGEALKNGLDDIFNRNQSVKNAYAKNTVTRATGEIGADGKPIMEKIRPDATFIENEFKPKVTDGRVDTKHLYDDATKEGHIVDLYDSLDNGLDDVIAKQTMLRQSAPMSVDELKALAIKSVKGDKQLIREGKVEKLLADIDKRFESYKTSYPEGISLDEVNKIRKTMNSPRNWNPDTQDIDRAVGNATRAIIYKIPGAKDLLQQQQLMKTAMNYAKAMNGKVVKGGRLGNMFWMWFGSKLGQATGMPIAGDILGLLGGRTLSKGLQNLTFSSPIGELKSKIGSLLEKSGIGANEIDDIVRDLQVVSNSAEETKVKINKPSSLRDILLKGSKDVQKQDTSLEKYIPDSELPTINAGKTPKSKYNKSIPGLPSIRY